MIGSKKAKETEESAEAIVHTRKGVFRHQMYDSFKSTQQLHARI